MDHFPVSDSALITSFRHRKHAFAVADVGRPACRDNADLPMEIPTGLEIAVDDLSHEGATGCKGNGYLRHICKELASTEIELAGCY